MRSAKAIRLRKSRITLILHSCVLVCFYFLLHPTKLLQDISTCDLYYSMGLAGAMWLWMTKYESLAILNRFNLHCLPIYTQHTIMRVLNCSVKISLYVGNSVHLCLPLLLCRVRPWEAVLVYVLYCRMVISGEWSVWNRHYVVRIPPWMYFLAVVRSTKVMQQCMVERGTAYLRKSAISCVLHC